MLDAFLQTSPYLLLAKLHRLHLQKHFPDLGNSRVFAFAFDVVDALINAHMDVKHLERKRNFSFKRMFCFLGGLLPYFGKKFIFRSYLFGFMIFKNEYICQTKHISLKL